MLFSFWMLMRRLPFLFDSHLGDRAVVVEAVGQGCCLAELWCPDVEGGKRDDASLPQPWLWFVVVNEQ